MEEEKLNKVEINKEEIPSEVINEMDKEIFFTASTARKKTLSVHKKRLEVKMLPIYQKINDAIAEGKYSIQMDLTKDERNFLLSKNFRTTATSSFTRNGEPAYTCNIYWS